MIVFEGEKYACLPCIRGHRSSTCNHCERPLLQVRKRGRPLVSQTKRIAIVPKVEDLNQHNVSKSSPIHSSSNSTSSSTPLNGSPQANGSANCHAAETPIIKIEQGSHCKKVVETKDGVVEVIDDQKGSCCSSGLCECDGCMKKKKVRLKLKKQQQHRMRLQLEVEEVFVPVGNGLYRKERRNKHTGEVIPDPPMVIAPMNLESLELPAFDLDDDYVPTIANQTVLPTSTSSSIQTHSPSAPASAPTIHFNSAPVTNLSNTTANGQQDFDFDLDFLMNMGEKNFLDVSYTPNCVLPGQCQCGDDCKCPGCSTHSNNGETC